MADSIPDINLNGAWQNIYALSGISVGTSISIQNKSSRHTLVFIKATTPTGDVGYSLAPLESITIDSGESGCWLKGNGYVFVQVA